MNISSTNTGEKRKEPNIELEGIFRDLTRFTLAERGVVWQLKVTTSPMQNIYITMTDEEMMDLLAWRKHESNMGWEETFHELVVQAKALGFDNVDVYIPDKESDEVVAFTFSKSEGYIDRVSALGEGVGGVTG